MHIRITLLALGTAIIGAAPTARAEIIAATGAITVVAAPPADISSNNWESNTQIRAFAEQQNILLPQDITADITLPGTSPSAVDANLSTAVIPAGTRVSSYMLHYDVVGQRATNSALEATGSISFGSDILGLLVLSDSENATNSLLGLTGVTYSSGTDHGLDLNPAGGGTSDVVTLSADRRMLTVDLRDASFADDIRVITAVPEPGSFLLAVYALGATLLRRRRKV